jgi:hypothetical protein
MPSAWPPGAPPPEPAMVTADQARAIALSLPEAVEQDHHGRPSFRVNGRIFATLWTPRALNVMVGEDRIVAAVEDDPRACSNVFWGRALSAVRVDLDTAGTQLVTDLLAEAWSRRAPRRLFP